jgi:hypothetical protein
MSVTSGFWMASSKRSSAEPLPARTTCETPRTARASEAGGVPRRLKHGRRCPSPSNDIRGKYLERQPQRSRPSPRGLAATEMLRDQYVQIAAQVADVPWERTTFLIAGIAMVSPARRTARLFLAINLNMTYT